MDAQPNLDTDVVIFGGGCAGLWILDALRHRGLRVVLLEANRLGSGQTADAQGILHGGLKYSLGGILSPAARMVSDMPAVWRASLDGQAEPDLSTMRLRSRWCYLWRTGSLKSWAGMLGAVAGLKVKPIAIGDDERPEPLASCPGQVYQLDEPVIDTISFLQVMARRNRGLLWRIDATGGLDFEWSTGRNWVEAVLIRNPDTGNQLRLRARQIILAAGEGNERLREQLGMPAQVAQRRPLRIALVRGRLPRLNGHSIDGAKTRVTITSDVDSSDRTVWQLGGQIAEDGVDMEPLDFIRHARSELAQVLPGWQCPAVEWATYMVNRAERSTTDGALPHDVQIIRDGNVLTVWPTKLVLAPLLSERVAAVLDVRDNPSDSSWQETLVDRHWPSPAIALAPWEREQTWISDV